MSHKFSAVIEKEGRWYVALCPELDIASQGETIEKALKNLKEALQLYLETASPEEIKTSTLSNPLITTLEVTTSR
ncbi:MAG: type II toxin-antitoxin system HicB family antitoxin [Elusimicrobiota bacterium]